VAALTRITGGKSGTKSPMHPAEIEHLAFLKHALQQAPPAPNCTQLIAILAGLHNELSQP